MVTWFSLMCDHAYGRLREMHGEVPHVPAEHNFTLSLQFVGQCIPARMIASFSTRPMCER